VTAYHVACAAIWSEANYFDNNAMNKSQFAHARKLSPRFLKVGWVVSHIQGYGSWRRWPQNRLDCANYVITQTDEQQGLLFKPFLAIVHL
jgi:hypothetical protein